VPATPYPSLGTPARRSIAHLRGCGSRVAACAGVWLDLKVSPQAPMRPGAREEGHGPDSPAEILEALGCRRDHGKRRRRVGRDPRFGARPGLRPSHLATLAALG